MHEQYINEAKRTLETLKYRNEQALKFEKFVVKFVKAVDELDKLLEFQGLFIYVC